MATDTKTDKAKTATKTSDLTPLERAQAARQKAKARRAAMSPTEVARYDVNRSIKRAKGALTVKSGCVANRLRTYRSVLTAEQKAQVVEYLEAAMQEVREAAFGKQKAAEQDIL